MALTTELYGLKSAGVYRFEKDQSVIQNTVEPLDNIRMLVGFSKTGPFNTPVMITTTKEFIDTFGDIDRSLEKKGAYFHRSCLAALSAGPIYALNLLKLTDEDQVSAMQFSTSATCTVQTVNPDDNMKEYRGMYNIDTFYTPSEESFLYNIGRSNTYITDGTSTNDILNFTNIGKNPVSVIVTKSSEYNSGSFQVTAQEWYGKGNVPEFLHSTSYISDFMVDVYVLSGDWGGDFSTSSTEPYARFNSDIKFSKYFDKNKGLLRRKNPNDTTDTLLTQFLNEPDVQLIGKYTGCLIPGFIDKNGHNMYIEYLINSDTAVNGLMCAVNEQIFDGSVLIDGDPNGIDMIGHTLYDAMEESAFSNVNFLSYSGNIANSITDAIAEGGADEYEEAPDGDSKYYAIDTEITPEAIEFAPAVSGSPQGIINELPYKWIDSVDKKEHTLYVYYYDEIADAAHTYIPINDASFPLAVEAKKVDDIYSKVKAGTNAFFVSDSLLVPVVSAKKTTLYVPTDRKLPVAERDETDPASMQSILNAVYDDYSQATMNSNPIIKYELRLVSESEVTFAGSTDAEYVFDTAYNREIKVTNGDNGTSSIMFLDGTNTYKNRASLGTNDYVMVNGTGSGDGHPRIDIDWYDNLYPVTTIGSYTIDNANYYPDYVVAKFNTDDNPSTTDDLGVDLRSGLENIYFFDYEGNEHVAEDGFVFVLGAQSFNTTITCLKEVNGVVAKPNQFIIPVNTDDDAYANVKVGNYALSLFGKDELDNPKHRLTRIVTITGIENANGIVDYRLVTCQDNVDTVIIDVTPDNVQYYHLEVFNKFVDWFTHYNVFTLKGFSLKASHMPDGTNERQHEILDMLAEDSEDSNLFNALIDRELIQFRYLVDTFGLGIEEMCKHQYTKLCQERKSAFAIINMPSVNDFKNSKDPSFVDKNKSVSAEYIAKGGDPNTNPSFLFSLPDKVHGSTWGAYYYPYLKVYSNYTTINVPPAAYVSNNYVAKYGAGSPWTLVAGQNRGVISGNSVVGVESSLIRDNRDWLEPAGINSIIYQNGIGCVIYANKTAQQTPKSALSSINCREACIYIQDGVEKILRNYLFETNTAQTRLEIKTLVDNFLDTVKNNGGVYDFKTIMDSSNNDAEVIDHNMGVIDIYVEPVRGLEILVQKLTILRTGAIQSGSFE